jgi:hypothetical protein
VCEAERSGSNPCVPFPKGGVSNGTIRQRHDRRRLAHVSWDLIRPSSWGLGQRGSRGMRIDASRSSRPSASYRSAGTEPGGAHDDDVETSEVGIVRERLLQPYGAGGRHLRLTASPREGQARVAEHVARRTRRVLHTNSFELGATRRKTGPRGHRPPDGASNRDRPKRVCLTAHRLFASLRARTRWVSEESSTRSTAMPRHLPCTARNDVG